MMGSEDDKTGGSTMRGLGLAHDTELGSAPDEQDLPIGLVERGTFGRFTILDLLGTGGMGVVLAAYDPQLDRRVAIKVLRTRKLSGARRDKEAARLLREARAMAQLSHPHVVTVYDAGTIDDRVFIAMEYISGQTLRSWLAEQRRDVDEILAVFIKAGRGLAAGHHAGLIHRDFKPENVLIGVDGRVCVIDFGLAQPARSAHESDDGYPASDVDPRQRSTTARGLFGTPLYMAPEQHDKRELDGRTDQFAFCVALFEALYGRPPFPASSYVELTTAVTTGKIEPPPPRPDIPQRVVAAVLRGLRTKPDERFPVMDALLDELEPLIKRRGFAAAWMGLGAIAAAGITLLVVKAVASGASDPCAGGQQRLAGTWDAPIASRVAQAFHASHRTHAPATADRVRALLDTYASRWVDRRRKVCEASKVRHEQSDLAFDLRMRCLARDLAALHATTELFSRADDATVDTAVSAVNALPSTDDCVGLMPGAVAPPTPAQRSLLDGLSRDIGDVEANLAAQRFTAAAAKAQQLVSQAKLVGYPRLDAEVRYRLGLAQSGSSKPADSEATLRDALVYAARAKDDALTSQIWNLLIYVIGYQQARYADALALTPVAELAVHRADDDPKLAADLAYQQGAVYFNKGEYKLATDSYERALKLHGDAGDQILTARMLDALGGAYLRTANIFGAKSAFEKSLAIFDKLLGPSHPDVALPLANLGGLAQAMGNFDEATKYQERALKILEEVHGPDDLNVGLVVYSLAVSANGREDYKGAIPYYERALKIFEAVSAEHPYVGLSLVGLADCREEVGDAETAVPEAERGLALVAKGSDAVQIALAKYVLAKAIYSAPSHVHDRPRARVLATEARKGFAAAGLLALNALAAVDAWFKKIDKP